VVWRRISPNQRQRPHAQPLIVDDRNATILQGFSDRRQIHQQQRHRYEDAGKACHDHLVAVDSGDVVEFADPRIEGVVREVSDRLGFDLVGWRLELLGRARRQS
jgi:Fe2+ or Zn2+ uptake regulation protein